jgi:hypothetical protein
MGPGWTRIGVNSNLLGWAGVASQSLPGEDHENSELSRQHVL